MQLGPTATVLALLVGLLVVVSIGVKFYDLKRKREAEAVHLQAQVSDALLRDPSLFGLAVTPTAHVPWWSGTPARLDVVGRTLAAIEDATSAKVLLKLVTVDASHIVAPHEVIHGVPRWKSDAVVRRRPRTRASARRAPETPATKSRDAA